MKELKSDVLPKRYASYPLIVFSRFIFSKGIKMIKLRGREYYWLVTYLWNGFKGEIKSPTWLKSDAKEWALANLPKGSKILKVKPLN